MKRDNCSTTLKHLLQVKSIFRLKLLTYVDSHFPLSPSPNFFMNWETKEIKNQTRLRILT